MSERVLSREWQDDAEYLFECGDTTEANYCRAAAVALRLVEDDVRKANSEKVDALLKVEAYHDRYTLVLDLLKEAVSHAYENGDPDRQFPGFQEAEKIVRASGRFNPPTAEDLTA